MDAITIDEAINRLTAGEMLVVVDDAERQDQGDVMLAAQFAAKERLNFLLTHARGLMYVAMPGARLDELQIGLVTQSGAERHSPAFCEPVDLRIHRREASSLESRAATMAALAGPDSQAADFVRPGHVYPIRARDGGVLVRAGHTEAAVDLVRIAGLHPAAALCEIMNEDGSMAHGEEIREFADRHGLPVVTIESLIKHRHGTERLVRHVTSTTLPTDHGFFMAEAYESIIDGTPYIAMVKGKIEPEEPTLVRVHSGCLTGDALHSLRCDCGKQLEAAMRMVEAEGKGVILYIHHQEGRGIGLLNKLKAYQLEDQGKDTVEANLLIGFPPDIRNYGIGAQVLADLGVRRMRLMTNNPAKVVGLKGYGLEVVERVPIEIRPVAENEDYLRTKKRKMGHWLHSVD